jgi:O-antigen ligase
LTSIRRHPWMGVGLGDVMNEMKVFYDRDFPGVQLKVLLPHNQFLMSGMAAGVGAIFLLVAILFFLWKKGRRGDLLFVAYWAIMLFAMMIEPLFETQYGTCMFLFFLLLLLHRQNNKEVLG